MPYFAGADQLKSWRSSDGPVSAGLAFVHQSYYIGPLDHEMEPFQGNILANTLAIAVSVAHATGSTQAFSSTAIIGLYTRSISTLNLVNSATVTFGYNGATSTSATWTNFFNGARMLTIASSQWSSAPYLLQGQHYWIGMGVRTHGFNGPMSMMAARTVLSSQSMSGALGVAGSSTISHNQWAIFRGAMSVTTTNSPASLQLSAIVASAATGINLPWIRIDNDIRNYA